MSPFTTVATFVKGSLHINSPTKGIVLTTPVYIYLTHHYEEYKKKTGLTSRITSLTHSTRKIQIVVKLQDVPPRGRTRAYYRTSTFTRSYNARHWFNFQLFNFESIFLLSMLNLCLLKNLNELGITFLTKKVQLRSQLHIPTIKMV
jgi:hypothetical protein